jgi:hypothetical protein
LYVVVVDAAAQIVPDAVVGAAQVYAASQPFGAGVAAS